MSTFASGLNVSGGELNVGLAFSVSQAGVVTATKFVGEVDSTSGNYSGVGTFSTLHVGTSGTVLAAVDSATISFRIGSKSCNRNFEWRIYSFNWSSNRTWRLINNI